MIECVKSFQMTSHSIYTGEKQNSRGGAYKASSSERGNEEGKEKEK